jgi:hypothetical protein
MATSTSTFSDEIDGLLIELSASLERPQRAAFEVAARAALAAAGCSGCGAAYRILAPLQRGYWDPPADPRIGQTRGSGIRRPSKLIDAPALGEDGPRVGERDRRQFRAG